MSLVVSSLEKVFGAQKAVNNISFEAKKGEILGFLGPNGAGKSTTMKIATCYLPPSAGRVTVCGFDVEEAPVEVRKRVGYLPEHNPLYLDMYVHEYLYFIASLHGLKGAQGRGRVSEIVELVGLTREQHKKIGQLSKGYRQRVGLAQALVHRPEVLILDEPTTGLDPNQIVEIRQVIKEVSRDRTVIFSTHIMQEVQALCDRVVIIHLGQLVANSSVVELQHKGNQPMLYLEFEQPTPTEFFEGLAGIEEIRVLSEKSFEIRTDGQKDVRPDVFRKSAAEGRVLLEIHQEIATLEQIFQTLTGGKRPN